MIPLQLLTTLSPRLTLHNPGHNPMMTRHCTRKHFPRSPYPYSPKRLTIRDNPVHHLRGILFPRVLLSILPLQPSPYPRTRWTMTPNRNPPSQPSRSTPTKYSHPPSFGSHCDMSTPQHYGKQPKTSNSRTHPYSPTRTLLHSPPSNRIL